MNFTALIAACTLLTIAVSSVEAAPDIARAGVTKRVALTFDDAPRGQGPVYSGEERGAMLLESLRSADSGPVAFFITTKNIDLPGNRQRVQNYANAGHLIANHSHSHLWLKNTETQRYLNDIDEAEKRLSGLTNRRAWFRFPYLDEGRPRSQRDAVREGLRQRQLMNGYVTIDNYDWYIEDKWRKAVDAGLGTDLNALRQAYIEMMLLAANFYHELARDSLGKAPSHVFLLHENDLAAMFIDDLIQALRDDGWQIISPDEAYRDPIAKIEPQTVITNQGHVGALAIDAGTDPRTLSHMAIEETQIDDLLERLQVFGEKNRNSTSAPLPSAY